MKTLPVLRLRWLIAILITVGVAIGYLDRQTLALTAKAIERDIPLSDPDFGHLQSLFYLAYGLMYVGGGRLMDLLGTRRGFLLIVVWWSAACAMHGLAAGFLMLAAGRIMLGLAQGGLFPVGAKAVAEWFPARERGTAMGMVNGGSSVGAVVAPPAIALVLYCLGDAHWPWVFYLSGAAGLVWAVWWLREYYPPARHPRLSAAERREIEEVLAGAREEKSPLAWWRLLGSAASPYELRIVVPVTDWKSDFGNLSWFVLLPAASEIRSPGRRTVPAATWEEQFP